MIEGLLVWLSLIQQPELPKEGIFIERNGKTTTIINNHRHAIYCVVNERGKMRDFYIMKKSRSAPFPIQYQFWCKQPGKSI